MATKKKLLQAAAGAAGGAGGLNIEDVFSTYLYDGTGSAQTITNGIDLSGEGGLVWSKNRGFGENHCLVDTVRGGTKELLSSSANAEGTSGNISAFNSNGYSFPSIGRGNYSGYEYVSWTFRKAPKFFDVVTYTGDGIAGKTISHNLGSVPGCILIKRTNTTGNWLVYHRGIASDAETDYLLLNSTGAAADLNSIWNDTAPTATDFTVGDFSFVNNSGDSYVAYLFAHNDGDGEFGPDGDADIIKCGSYSGNSTIGHTIDLGFEAQWVLVRSTSNLRKWFLYDAMRGMPVDGNGAALYPNSNDDEEALQRIGASNVGFQLTSTDSMVNVSGETYIYIAIRRGPMAVPESATDVFDISHAVNTIDTSWPVDLAITTQMSGDSNLVRDRLRGSTTANRTPYLKTDATSAEADGGIFGFDDMTGLGISGWGTGYVHWLWRRAPNFFDVVAYDGTGAAQNITHNLGVVPEMMWIKERSDDAASWYVWHSSFSANDYIWLNFANAKLVNSAYFPSVPTDTQFSVGTSDDISGSGDKYIAYLFASLDGVSKVGSVNHVNGTRSVVDCGFSNGARFVLFKYADSSTGIGGDPSNWHVFDTERGIIGGIDPRLSLNTTDAEINTGNDYIDPDSSGFSLPSGHPSGTYIFYAIA